MANAIAKPRKIQMLSLVPIVVRSNVPLVRPKATIATSISSEPTIV